MSRLKADIAKLQATEEGCTVLALAVLFGGFALMGILAVIFNAAMMIGDWLA